MTNASPPLRRRVVTGSILAVGWIAAVVVYATASPVADDPDVYDIEHSKRYLRQLEMIGGKAAVFTSELNEWVASLWHGRALAYTIAVLTIAVAIGYWLWDRAPRSRSP